MFIVHEVEPNQFQELPQGGGFTWRGVTYDWGFLTSAYDPTLAQMGLYRVFAEPVPAGYNATSRSFVRVDGEVKQKLVLEEIPPTDAAVNAERNRRFDLGFEFDGVWFDSKAVDRENILGAAQLAFMAIVAGAQPGNLRWHGGTSDFVWIVADNSQMPMDAHTVIAMGKAAAAQKQKLIMVARWLKDQNPIPSDFRSDHYWQ